MLAVSSWPLAVGTAPAKIFDSQHGLVPEMANLHAFTMANAVPPVACEFSVDDAHTDDVVCKVNATPVPFCCAAFGHEAVVATIGH